MNPGCRIIVRRAPFDHGCEEDLGNDGAQFAEAGGEAVASGTDSSGEDFGGGYESCSIGSWKALLA